MKFAKAWDLKIMEGGHVSFVSAAHQVLRFTILEDDPARIEEILTVDNEEAEQQRKRQSRKLSLFRTRSGREQPADEISDIQNDLQAQIAAAKLVQAWKIRKSRKSVMSGARSDETNEETKVHRAPDLAGRPNDPAG